MNSFQVVTIPLAAAFWLHLGEMICSRSLTLESNNHMQSIPTFRVRLLCSCSRAEKSLLSEIWNPVEYLQGISHIHASFHSALHKFNCHVRDILCDIAHVKAMRAG